MLATSLHDGVNRINDKTALLNAGKSRTVTQPAFGGPSPRTHDGEHDDNRLVSSVFAKLRTMADKDREPCALGFFNEPPCNALAPVPLPRLRLRGGQWSVNYPNSALRWWPAAVAGDSDAAFHLGLALQDGDPEEAGRWYRRAAEAGHVDAAVNLGVLLIEHDPDEAAYWLRTAAEAGDADAAFNLGLFLHNQRPDEAVRWYRQAIGLGLDAAALNLGELLKDKDSVEAEHWYVVAADAGSVDAAFNLGLLLRERDPARAVMWWRRAAQAGDREISAKAAHNLGVILSGEAPTEAEDWYRHAANAGHTGAALNLGLLKKEEAPAEAAYWILHAADSDDADIALRATRNISEILRKLRPSEATRYLQQLVGHTEELASSIDNRRRARTEVAEILVEKGIVLREWALKAQAIAAFRVAADAYAEASDAQAEFRARGQLVLAISEADSPAAHGELVRMGELAAQLAADAGDHKTAGELNLGVAMLLSERESGRPDLVDPMLASSPT